MVTPGLRLRSEHLHFCLIKPSFLIFAPFFKPLSSRLQRNALRRFCSRAATSSSSAPLRSTPPVRSSLKSTPQLRRRPCINSTRWARACCWHKIYLVRTSKQTLHVTAANEDITLHIAQHPQFEIAGFFRISAPLVWTQRNPGGVISVYMLTWHVYTVRGIIKQSFIPCSDQQTATVTLSRTWSLCGTSASWPPASSCWENPVKTLCTTWLRWPTSRSW